MLISVSRFLSFLYSFAYVVRSNPGFLCILYTMNKCEWDLHLIKRNIRLMLLQPVSLYNKVIVPPANIQVQHVNIFFMVIYLPKERLSNTIVWGCSLDKLF